MTPLLASVLLAAPVVLVAADDQPRPALVTPKEGPAVVEVRELPPELYARMKAARPRASDWHPVFRVVVAGGTPQEVLARPPVAGTYTLTQAGVRFEPQFPFVPGREYVAIVRAVPHAEPLLTTFSLPSPPPGPRVAVTAVYPSANRLPENTLRFYLHFSGPVARGDVYRHLRLVRDDGVVVDSPFLQLPEELWSPDGNRLTVFFHPGRVKRGLVPRAEEGPILEEGRTYTLSISGNWQDTEGRPLLSGFHKTFTVEPPDDHPVDPADWSLVPPRAGTDAPLVVRLPRPLDHALLGRLVSVTDAAGKPVPGQLTVGGGERVLTFAPHEAWLRGEYRLVVDTRLEDVCGNRVGEPFEVDVLGPITPRIEVRTVERAFTVR